MMLLISEMLLTNNDVKVVDNEVHDNVDEVVASKVFFLMMLLHPQCTRGSDRQRVIRLPQSWSATVDHSQTLYYFNSNFVCNRM